MMHAFQSLTLSKAQSLPLAIFPQLKNDDWVAIQSLSAVIQSIVVIVTAIFAYHQLRQAARSSQFDAVMRLQSSMDSFQDDRRRLFETFPLDLALSNHQFGGKPPARWLSKKTNEGQRRAMMLTDKQLGALKSLSPDQLDVARRVINRLNDLGQLVEDGFLPKDVFFGKYHLLILRCCHILEPVRRQFEEKAEGGNYGQRLLRLRYQAARYNDIVPKHREVSVYITNQTERNLIYRSQSPNPWRLSIWTINRLFHRY
jgi:hypothetical protein